jgi:hypothetical protein
MSAAQIGRDGLARFVEELNGQRARLGIQQRYQIIQVGGVMTMVEDKRAEQGSMLGGMKR